MQTKELDILKNGFVETTIDWKRYEDLAEENNIGIDCLNQMDFEIK